MEEKLLKLFAQVSLIGVLVYVVGAALGKGDEFRFKHHPKDRKMDPNSPVWAHSNVQGPNASTNRAAAIVH